VTVDSVHVVLATTATDPPDGLSASTAFATWIRNRASCTGPASVERSKRRKLCRVGLASAMRRALVPKLVFVEELST
jgi:hypothetical protein